MECLLQNLHNYQTTTWCVPTETLYVMQSATEEDYFHKIHAKEHSLEDT